MEKELIKLALALAVVVLIAYVVAERVSKHIMAQHKQNSDSRTWQASLAVAPMADEAFVNWRR